MTTLDQPSAVTCGFRDLRRSDMPACDLPPHRIGTPHRWPGPQIPEDGDPAGWRNAVDPNKTPPRSSA